MAFSFGRQPQGFVPQNVEATLLDPRTKDLRGIPAGEHEECWALLTTRLIPFVARARAKEAPRAPRPLVPLKPGDDGYDSANEDDRDYAPWDKFNMTVAEQAAACVAEYRKHRADITKFPDGAAIEMSRCPLTWWKAVGNKYGFLRLLARAALAAPATSAPVERLFSECSLIMTKKRNRMSPANLSLLTCLNRSWHVAIE